MIDRIRAIEREILPGQLLAAVEGVTRFHRIQVSNGFKASAEFMADRLREAGVEARVLSYPSGYGQEYLGWKTFDGWDCREAFLKLVSPEEMVLADFASMPTSLIQRSGPCDHTEKPVEIVLLDKGPDESAYPGVDLSGKLVFVRDDFSKYIDWAVEKRGALGIITDCFERDRGKDGRLRIAEVSRYQSFWYYEEPKTAPFGFSISPMSGERLSAACRKAREEHEKDPSKPSCPAAVCRVDAAFHPGTIDIVEAVIRGTGEGEVWLTAHLCHPKHWFNDNASGVAAASEAIITLQRMISEGKLPALKRTLRVLLLPELLGDYPYLENNANRERCVAALNLDMVGGKQELGCGPLAVIGLPLSSPSLAADLCAAILKELQKEAEHISPGLQVPMFHAIRTDFAGGSDHVVFSDPMIGIPTPMINQWPDPYYHTGGDTLDKISSRILAKSAALAASFAWLTGNLSADDLPYIFREQLAELVRRVNDTQQGHTGCGVSLGKKMRFLEEFFVRSAAGAQDLFEGEDRDRAAEKIRVQQQKISAVCHALREDVQEEPEEHPESSVEIPVRSCRAVRWQHGRVTDPDRKAADEAFEKQWGGRLKHTGTLVFLAQYYMDGRRTVGDIAERILFEAKETDLEAVTAFLYYLRDIGIWTAG